MTCKSRVQFSLLVVLGLFFCIGSKCVELQRPTSMSISATARAAGPNNPTDALHHDNRFKLDPGRWRDRASMSADVPGYNPCVNCDMMTTCHHLEFGDPSPEYPAILPKEVFAPRRQEKNKIDDIRMTSSVIDKKKNNGTRPGRFVFVVGLEGLGV
jgi:hypothetical protein